MAVTCHKCLKVGVPGYDLGWVLYVLRAIALHTHHSSSTYCKDDYSKHSKGRKNLKIYQIFSYFSHHLKYLKCQHPTPGNQPQFSVCASLQAAVAALALRFVKSLLQIMLLTFVSITPQNPQSLLLITLFPCAAPTKDAVRFPSEQMSANLIK